MRMGLRRRMRQGTAMPRDVLVLTLNAFFVAVGFGVMMPVLPVYARTFGVDFFHISWVISAFAVMRLVTAPLCPPLYRLITEKGGLVIGTALVGASSFACGLATSYWQLLLFRALGGIGSAMFTVAAMTLLLESVAPHLRGRASGFYQGGFLIGGMAGPALGGLVAKISMQAPFFFYAATLMAGAISCFLFLDSRPRVTREDRAAEPPGAPLGEALRDVRYQASLATVFAQGWQSFGVRSALVPIIVTDVLGRTPEWTGYAMAVAAVAQTLALPAAGRYTDTVGRRPVMMAAGIVTGLSAIAMPYATSMWMLTLALAIYGIGSAAHSTAPTAAVGDVTGGRGGTPIAVFSMMSDVGAIVGPLVAGYVADKAGLGLPFLLGGLLLLGGSLYSWFMPHEDLTIPALDQPIVKEEATI